jgi:hypothetical protein
MIAFAGDTEPSANSYFASAAAALLSAINRFFCKEPAWRLKRRTKVEDTEDFVQYFGHTPLARKIAAIANTGNRNT